MAEKTFNQDFKGYYLNTTSLPSISGVYVVQSYIYNKDKDNISLKNLIYIGKADDINNRVTNHEKIDDWKKELKYEEQLCYSYTEVSTIYNERVEAALINANQPIVNTEYKIWFPFDKTTVNSNGRFSLLKENIVVNRY